MFAPASGVCVCVLCAHRVLMLVSLHRVCNNILLENGNLATNFDIGFSHELIIQRLLRLIFFRLNIGMVSYMAISFHSISGTCIRFRMFSNFIFAHFMNIQYLSIGRI